MNQLLSDFVRMLLAIHPDDDLSSIEISVTVIFLLSLATVFLLLGLGI